MMAKREVQNPRGGLLTLRALLLFLTLMAVLLTIAATVSYPSQDLISDQLLQPSVAQAPVYLGRADLPQVVMLGRNASFSPRNPMPWYPLWPGDSDFLLPSAARFTPVRDPVDIGLYHVPSIVEFLSPDYRPEGINYTNYVPALGEFASPGWVPPKDSRLYHVPAITSFLEEDWQPNAPDYNGSPPWIHSFLNA
jgi:hypothetical protein